MSAELLTTDQAQSIFTELPGSKRIPSLSPEFSSLTVSAAESGNVIHLMSRDKCGLILSSVHERTIPETDFRDWQAPYNYGGTTVTGPATPERWTPLAAVARERSVIAEFHRFHPLSDSAGLRRDHSWFDRVTVAIPLAGTYDATINFKASAQGAVKKAIKSGLTVREAELSGSGFSSRYLTLMNEKGARQELRFGDLYFEGLARLECVRLLEALRDGEVVGSVVILVGPDFAEYHLGEANHLGRKYSATNLLLAEATRLVQRMGCKWFFLGGGTSTDAQNSLLKFKLSLSNHTAQNFIGGSVYSDVYYDLNVRSIDRFLRYRSELGG